jgi:hypothetical protein
MPPCTAIVSRRAHLTVASHDWLYDDQYLHKGTRFARGLQTLPGSWNMVRSRLIDIAKGMG